MSLSTRDKPTLATLYALWSALGDVPTGDGGDTADCLEEPFRHFPVGTHRETVWHWFETQNPKFIVGEVMQGIRHVESGTIGAAHA